MTMVTPRSLTSEPEVSIVLREFFQELFSERMAAMNEKSQSDCASCDTKSISLSSDEETADSRRDSSRRRRRRLRKPQRPKITLSPDNAAGVRSGKTAELMISSYHNRLNMSEQNGRDALSNSSHSLGSRAGISSTSIASWRNSLHKHRKVLTRQEQRKNHKDSRWSTDPLDIPNNSRSSRVKQYDLGFVNDSMHVRNTQSSKKKQRKHNKRMANINNSLCKKDRNTPASDIVDSAVRFMTYFSSDDESTDGEEFFDDDEESITESVSSFGESFLSSQANITVESTKTLGSSLDFGSRYKTRAKALTACSRVTPSRTKSGRFFSSRVTPSRTKSGGDLPRMPRRTSDDSSFKVEEIFEPLKGNSSSHHTSFKKKKVRRSLSDDVSIMSRSSKRFESVKRKITHPFGRWAASATNKKDEAPKNDNLRKPNRNPSLSSRSKNAKKKGKGKQLKKDSKSSNKGNILKFSNRSTGRYSNHSNDSSDPSDSESEISEFHNSFFDDDDSTTQATTESSTKFDSTGNSSSSEQNEAYKFLFQPTSSHSRNLTIPETLRRLPLGSFHGSSTISTKSTMRLKRPGKSLRTTSRW